MTIIEIKTYINDQGMYLQERVAVKGEMKKDAVRFLGTMAIGINTPMGPKMQEVEFPINATDTEDAFNKFETSAKAYVEELKQKQQQASRIVTATPDHLEQLQNIQKQLPSQQKGKIII